MSAWYTMAPIPGSSQYDWYTKHSFENLESWSWYVPSTPWRTFFILCTNLVSVHNDVAGFNVQMPFKWPCLIHAKQVTVNLGQNVYQFSMCETSVLYDFCELLSSMLCLVILYYISCTLSSNLVQGVHVYIQILQVKVWLTMQLGQNQFTHLSYDACMKSKCLIVILWISGWGPF